MKKILFIILLMKVAIMGQNIDKLKNDCLEIIKSDSGEYGVAFTQVNKPEISLFINENELFHAASTYKTAVMVEVFNQVEKGEIKLDDELLIKNEFRSIVDSSIFSLDLNTDSGEMLYKYIGKKRKIYDLVYDMITVSSNFATNLLIDKIGAKNVMKTLHRYNIEKLNVLRGVEDIKAFDNGLNNTTDAESLMKLFLLIAQNNMISKDASQKMIKILSNQKFNDLIPELLPLGLKIAHKTGSITGIQHDAGIIYLPNGREYILVLLSKSADENLQKKILQKLSLVVYNFMINNYK